MNTTKDPLPVQFTQVNRNFKEITGETTLLLMHLKVKTNVLC